MLVVSSGIEEEQPLSAQAYHLLHRILSYTSRRINWKATCRRALDSQGEPPDKQSFMHSCIHCLYSRTCSGKEIPPIILRQFVNI